MAETFPMADIKAAVGKEVQPLPSNMPMKMDNKQMNFSVLSTQINNTGRRLRLLEERYQNLRKKSQLSENNLLEISKRFNIEAKNLTMEIGDIKRELSDLKEKLRTMIGELMDTAKKNDLTLLSKYLELWEPMQFVTEKDVVEIVKRVIAEKDQKNR